MRIDKQSCFCGNRQYARGLCQNCYARDHYRKNRDRIRSNASRANLKYRSSLRQEVITAYGGCCACCGESANEFLTLDHKFGGGSKERRSGLQSHKLWARLKKANWPKDEHQLLCMNCNWATRHGKSCPHKRCG